MEDLRSINSLEGRRAGRTTASLQHAAKIFVEGENVIYVATTQDTSRLFREILKGMLATLDPETSYDFEANIIQHPTRRNWIRFESLSRTDRQLSRRGLSSFVQIPDHSAFEVLDSENERLRGETRDLKEAKRALEEKLDDVNRRFLNYERHAEILRAEIRSAIEKFEGR